MSTKTIIWIVVAVIVVAAIVVFLAMPKVQAPASSTGSNTAPTATSSGTLGGQIYENIAPQAAVPQNLPQVNPFGQ